MSVRFAGSESLIRAVQTAFKAIKLQGMHSSNSTVRRGTFFFLVLLSGIVYGQSDLFVSSGDTLVVTPGHILHVNGSASGSGYIDLQADATAYSQLSQTDDVSNSVNLILGKRMASAADGWRYMAFPFSGTFADLNFNSTMPFIHAANDGGIPARHNFFAWNSTDAGGSAATGWESVSSNHSLPAAASVYLANNGVHDFSQDIQVSGTPFNGEVTFSLYYTLDPAFSGGVQADASGWNYIPNPYPSNLSLNVLLNAACFPGYKAVHVWDQSTGQFVAVLPSGVAINYNTTGSNNNSTTHIAPLEGFWVKADNSGNSLILTNAMRDAEGTATAFYKKDPELLRLNLLDNHGRVDQVVVYFDPAATTSYDLGLEALKRVGDQNAPQMAVIEGAREISIAALPSGSHSLPLKVAVPRANMNYSFALNDDDMDTWSSVELEDKQTGQRYDLRALKTADFNFASNVIDDRFVLHVNKSGVAISESEQLDDELQAWQNTEGLLLIQGGAQTEGTVQVCNLNGQVLYTETLERGQDLVLSSSLAPGIYFVYLTKSNSQPLKVLIQ